VDRKYNKRPFAYSVTVGCASTLHGDIYVLGRGTYLDAWYGIRYPTRQINPRGLDLGLTGIVLPSHSELLCSSTFQIQ
jgi:hypothetical protein